MTSSSSGQKSNISWLPAIFALFGISFGLVLLGFGGWKLTSWVDHFFPKAHGKYKAQLLSNRVERSPLGDLFYHAHFELSLPKKTLKVKLRLPEDKSLYRYLQGQKWGKVYRVRLARRPLSRQWTLTRVDNVTVGKKRKTNEGVIYLGLLIMGGALIFAAIKNYFQQQRRSRLEEMQRRGSTA